MRTHLTARRIPFIFSTLCAVACTLIPWPVRAQDKVLEARSDTAVIVRATRFTLEQTGAAVYSDSLTVNEPLSMAQTLNYQTPLFIKSYGPAALQSAAARGSGAEHLAVLWNGIRINSATHGQVDLALTGFTGRWDFVPGANGVLDGSGATGGMLLLSDAIPDIRRRAVADISLGSFHSIRAGLAYGIRKNRLATAFSARWSQARNDFPYPDIAVIGHPIVRRENSQSEILNVQSFTTLKITRLHRIDWSVWLTTASRQIPPVITAANDHAVQADTSVRTMVIWRYETPRRLIRAATRLAYLRERQRYESDAVQAQTRTDAYVLDHRWSLPVRQRHSLHVGTNVRFDRARSSGYAQLHKQWTTALFAAYRLRSGFQAQTRLEAIDFARLIPVYSLAFGRRIAPGVRIRIKAGRHYRWPTFNDRFWAQLGRPDLKPERGIQAEAGADWQHTLHTWNLKTSLTAFWMDLTDRIVWAPDDQGIWRPANYKKVRTKGIEYTASAIRKGRAITWRARAIYALTDARNIESYGTRDIVHKRLIYIPVHKLTARLAAETKHWTWATDLQSVGRRPADPLNHEYLDGYATMDVAATYRKQFRNIGLSVHARVRNVWNRFYQVLPYRPMPGRSFEAGLTVKHKVSN